MYTLFYLDFLTQNFSCFISYSLLGHFTDEKALSKQICMQIII
jgi:hypothetical protein